MLSLASGHHVVVRRGQAEVVATRKEHWFAERSCADGHDHQGAATEREQGHLICAKKDFNFASVSA